MPEHPSIESVLELIASGRASAREVVRSALERAKETAELGGFISLDESAEVERPAPAVTLAGVPFAVKDNIDTADLATTAGTPGLMGSVPLRDSPVVAALRRSGAVLVGKTNLHELAFGVSGENPAFGSARNPRSPDRCAGGSSSGSAVVVASGVVPFALGSDTGGSCRIPASWCGVVGFRPSTGRWSSEGVVPISHSRDTVGLLASTVGDVQLVDAVITGEGRESVGLCDFRLGVPDGLCADLDPEVESSFERSLGDLGQAGAEPVHVPFGLDALAQIGSLEQQIGYPIVAYEMPRAMARYLGGLRPPYDALTLAELRRTIRSPDVARVVGAILDEPVSQQAYSAGRRELERFRTGYLRAFDEHGVAAFVYPTVPVAPPALGCGDRVSLNGRDVSLFFAATRNTVPASLAGTPAISVPCHPTSAGLPVGLSIETRPGNDPWLLGLAASVEAALSR
jgi:mandelamide amidase